MQKMSNIVFFMSLNQYFLFLSVAEQVVNTEQKIKGKVVRVKLVERETDNTETVDTPGKEFPTVLVSGLPEGSTQNGVHIHFQKNKNGGGEIKKVILRPETNEATVVFEEIEG